MKVKELIQKLSELSDEQKELPALVQDGCDPSDPGEATRIIINPNWPMGIGGIEISV